MLATPRKHKKDSTITPASGSETDIYVFFPGGANRSANRRGPSIKVPAHSPDLYDLSHAGLVNLLSQYRSKSFWFESRWTQNYNSSFWFPCHRCGILLRPRQAANRRSYLWRWLLTSAAALSHIPRRENMILLEVRSGGSCSSQYLLLPFLFIR